MNTTLTRLTRPAQRLWVLYACLALASIGVVLLFLGVFFYTTHSFGWSLLQNFLLAVFQGLTYAVGALLAEKIARRWGRRRSLLAANLLAAALPLTALLFPTPAVLPVALLAYSMLLGMICPWLESLVSSGLDATQISRRIGIYNLVWAGVGALMVAINGAIIEHWLTGVLLVPAVAHLISAALIGLNYDAVAAPTAAAEHAAPPPQLLHSRRLALWLSRLSLPATYMVICSLMAMMPALPVMQSLSPTAQTLVCSTWLIVRLLAFVVLGATVWWHTRPMLLLWSAVLMLVAFVGVTVAPSRVIGGSWPLDLCSMIAWQILLGAAIGLIYSASLYFGMVLSAGSTEHGGYHEALIGLGSVLGPGAGAVGQTFWPGNVNAAIGMVTAVISLSVLAAAAAAMVARRQGE